MKTIRHILLAAIALAFGSCITDEKLSGGTAGETPVRITITAGAQDGTDDPVTRTANPGDPADRRISSLRVLGYRADGSLAFNSRVPGGFNAGGGFTGDIEVMTGRYTLVFIANETSDDTPGSLPSRLAALTPGANYIHELGGMAFAARAFRANADIPMIARVDDVTIVKTADGNPAIGAANGQGTFSVTMRRLGIRLDLTVTLYAVQFDAWYGTGADNEHRRIYFEREPDRVFLFGKDNSASYASDNNFVEYSGNNPTAGADGCKTFTLRRVILPETLFAPVGNAGKALRMSLWDGRKWIKGNISVGGSTTDYTIPRNTFLNVTAKSKEWDVEMSATVADWNDATMAGDAGGRYYTVTVNNPADATQGTATADISRQLPGRTVTVLVSPAPGRVFSHWTAAGVTLADPAANPAVFTMPAADVTITPVFGVAQPYTVTIATVTGGTASADRASAWPGQTVTLTASSAPNYVLSHYTVTRSSDGAAIPVTSNSFTMPAADVTVTPVFGDRLYKVFVAHKDEGMTITANDPVSEAALNGAGVVAGTQVSLTASCSAQGFAFNGWDQYGPSWLHPNDPAYVADGFTWVSSSPTLTFEMLAATDTTPGGRKIALYSAANFLEASVSNSPFNATGSGFSSRKSIRINTNADWSMTISPGFTLVNSSGSHTYGYALSVGFYVNEQNLDAMNEKTGTITITATGVPAQTFTISQKKATPSVKLNPIVSGKFPDEWLGEEYGPGMAKTFTVTSNTPWTMTRNGNGDYVSVSPLTGNPQGIPGHVTTVTVYPKEANTSTRDNRMTFYRVKSDIATTKVDISFRQNKVGPILRVSASSLPTWNWNEGGYRTFTVESNVSWTASGPAAFSIVGSSNSSTTLNTKEIKIYCHGNNTDPDNAIEGYITITGGGVSKTVYVKKLPAPPWAIPPAGDTQIGNLVWANTNLSGYKTFAANPTDFGAYFQTHSNIVYTYSGGATPPVNHAGIPWNEWDNGDHPCPRGWRVPTAQEMRDSGLTNMVGRQINGVNGFAVSGTNLFFPVTGIRGHYWGPEDTVEKSYPDRFSYWSSSMYRNGSYDIPVMLKITAYGLEAVAEPYSDIATPIRCVRNP